MSWLWGHAGIFEGCETHDHSAGGRQWVIECLDERDGSVQRNLFETSFRHCLGVRRTSKELSFWGVRTQREGLNASQQGAVIDALRDVNRQLPWSFFNYKNPSRGFRCDGLLEWAYEQAGLDIVTGDTWFFHITPRKQFNRLCCVP